MSSSEVEAEVEDASDESSVEIPSDDSVLSSSVEEDDVYMLSSEDGEVS